MAEYSRVAKGSFTSTGAAKYVNLPFQPDAVEIFNYTVANSAATSQNVASAYWDVTMGQGFAIQQGYNATPTLIYDTVVANGISTFSAGLLLQYGPRQQIVGATKASPIVFNVTAHGYSVGDVVIFEGLYQSATTGMPQIAGIPFQISAVGDADHFTVVWNGNQSNYTALSGSPTGAYVKKVLYPFLYEPAVAFISAVTTGTTTTVTTTVAHNFEVGQEIAFRIPSVWGITQLNSLPNVLIPGSPIYGYVVSVTNNTVFVCNINSTGFSAYANNPTVASVPGLSWPQVLAVGDVNTGGNLITAGSPLYPSPQFPTSTNRVPTINGPAIRGAFVNNTSQGFIVGTGAGTVLTTSSLVGANTNVIYWRAYLSDYANP
jgi:hypothetical protein